MMPGKVSGIRNMGGKKYAVVDYSGDAREAVLEGVDADIGDYVLVQAGIVVQKVDAHEAEESLRMLSKSLNKNKAELK